MRKPVFTLFNQVMAVRLSKCRSAILSLKEVIKLVRCTLFIAVCCLLLTKNRLSYCKAISFMIANQKCYILDTELD